jgi:hypothetical protein
MCERNPQPATARLALILLALCVVAILPYTRALTLPLIADSYDQIYRGRIYAPIEKWPEMLSDPLYRCRATSLLLTHWTERTLGIAPLVLRGSSLLLHVLNTWLIFLFGRFRFIGWRLAAAAAAFFAIAHAHQTAVTWYAAIPELLVFLFSLLSVYFWLVWVTEGSSPVRIWLLSFLCFVLAIFSKESGVAVVPILALAVCLAASRRVARLLYVLPFALVASAYFAWAFVARSYHQHFNDGTFVLGWHFLGVLWQSSGRLFWFWGLVSLVVLLATRAAPAYRLPLVGAVAWVGCTFLPYSFLTYMPYVPSRHTYLASAGQALVVGCGLLALWNQRRRLAVIVAVAMLTFNCGYLWTRKYHQMLERALPTEQLVAFARSTKGPIYVQSFPYSREVAVLAVVVGANKPPASVVWDPDVTRAKPGDLVFHWNAESAASELR